MEEVGGELGIFPDKGVELMGGGCWGVDGQVGVPRHCSAVEGAEGVSTKGGVGLAMFEWWSLLWFAALGPLSRCWWFEGIGVVKVPRQGREVPVEGW